MIALAILFYSVRLYKAGDDTLQRAIATEKIGTWLGIGCLALLVVALAVHGHYGGVLDAAAARLDALSALGCNGLAVAGELCVRSALLGIEEVTYAASAQSWTTMAILSLVIL